MVRENLIASLKDVAKFRRTDKCSVIFMSYIIVNNFEFLSLLSL